MSSFVCAVRHGKTPIESLCRVFGIPSSTIPRASISLSINLHQQRYASRRFASHAAFLSTRQPPKVASRFLHVQKRALSNTTPKLAIDQKSKWKSIEQMKSRGQLGPLTFKAAILFVACGVALVFYFREERARMERRQIAEQNKGMGRPKVGGDFVLTDHNGNTFTSEDLKGKHALVYFGFTHCPDICPDELDKMADMIDRVKAQCGDVLTPIMITCDPARDTPQVLKPYIEEFHPDLIGLTGDYESIKQTCKLYRVYFSTPQQVKPGQDYLVDHSIYFYLMDPEGDFVEAIGRNFSAEQASEVIRDHVKDWKSSANLKVKSVA